MSAFKFLPEEDNTETVKKKSKKRKREKEEKTEEDQDQDSNKVAKIDKNVQSGEKGMDVKKSKNKKKKKQVLMGENEISAEVGGFTIIGDINAFKSQKVSRVLPSWLSNPSIVSSNLKDNSVPIRSLKLCNQLVKLLEQNYVHYLFPVQQQVIPWLIKSYSPMKIYRPSDICVSAPTGSGKTLGYVLPIVQIIKNRTCPHIQVIVVLPTDLLASQVFSVFQTYSSGTDLRTYLMSKRVTVSAERKLLINSYGRCPFDIIVATTGRLLDHLENTKGFDISRLKFLVVDEADRTFDDQEGDWLERLEIKFWSSYNTGINQPWKALPLTVKYLSHHQKAFHKLLFSATLSQNPETLEKLHLFQPKLFTSITAKSNDETISESFIGKFTTPEELKESFVLCQKDTKPIVLTHLLNENKWKRVLCFVNTKEDTHRLCLLLQSMGITGAKEISSNWSPKNRDLILKMFGQGKINILITSDQMARGIDVPNVDHVISYDVPSHTKTYIHRIGRTARAGKEGQAISLVEKEKIGIFKKTIKEAGKSDFERLPVKRGDLKALEPKFKEALLKLKEILGEEAKKQNKK